MSLPKPDYEREGVRLWLADCLTILPLIPAGTVNAVVTDPPYGINHARDRNSQQWGWTDFEVTGWDEKRPTQQVFDAVLNLNVPTVIWGGNYFTDYLPPSSKWLVWDKGQTDFSLADVELAWCSFDGAARRLMYHRAKALADVKVHPTQKPIAVMAWCLDQLPVRGETILDPFTGSGTTAVACIRTGRRFMGCEIEPRYFDIAVKRIEQAFADTALFREAEAEHRQAQGEMFP